MSVRAQYSDDEWAQVISAPAAAIAAVIGSSPGGPLAIMQEVGAAVKAFERAAEERRANPLIAAVLLTLKARFEAYMGKKPEDGAVEQIDIMALGKNPATAVATVAAGAALVSARTPGPESDEFRAWLLEVATAVAAAASEGGFFGIGGQQVSAEEQAVLQELRAALGLGGEAIG